jgi:polysaccharide biosynthesis protein PslJ
MSAIADPSTAEPTSEVEASGRRVRLGPVRILQTYVVLMVLIPSTYIIEPLGGQGTPATVLGIFALLLWGLAILVPGEHLARTVMPVRVVMGVLVGIILVGYTVLHSHYVRVDELLASDRMVLQVLSWAGVALLAAEGLRDREELRRVLRVLCVCVAVMAVVGVLQFRAGIDLAALVGNIPGLHENAEHFAILERSGFRRPSGTAAHPFEFGSVIAMTLAIALTLARFDLGRSRVRRWLPVGLMAIGIPVAVSRSVILAGLVVLVMVIVGLEPRMRPRALGSVAAFVVAIYVTTPGLLGTLRDLFVHAGQDNSITLRTDDYSAVMGYVQQSPLIGRGPGTFLPLNYFFLDNQYLLTVVEIGIIGLIVVIGYLFSAAFLGRGARHRSADPETRDLGQALAAASVAAAVVSFTFDAFSFMMFAGYVPLVLGAAGALWKTVRDDVPATNDRPAITG